MLIRGLGYFLNWDYEYMGGCQNYGPFLGTLNIRCRIIIGIQKGTIILTTTHMISSATTDMRNLQRHFSEPRISAPSRHQRIHPKLGGPFSGGPHKKDFGILGSILG